MIYLETTYIINKIAKISIINIFTYIVFIKLINYKDNNLRKTIIMITFSIIESIIGRIFTNYIVLPVIIAVYLMHSFISSKITNTKFQYSIIVTCISLTITYILYIISILVSSFVLKLIQPNIGIDSVEILILAAFIELLILYWLSKVKRFKNGFAFLQNKEKINNVGIMGFAFVGIAIVIFALVDVSRGNQFRTFLIIGILIEAICITVWIRRKITKYYKQKIKEKTIEELENEIKVRDLKISKILQENQEIATINHKYSSRIKALEKFSAEILERPKLVEKMKEEFGAEFGDIQTTIKKLSEEYTKEINDKIKISTPMVKTKIFGIDNILEYMKEEAERNNISFNLIVDDNIQYMVEKIINQSKLETLLCDHIKDAIIAIKCSENTYKSIQVKIGLGVNFYEICIYDSGIEFEIDTLLKLGTEAITTHKASGGSGIGFMTTFETLKETKASIIIEERHKMTANDYTKAVKIRFDGKREYKICSYRANEIEKQNSKRKVIIENILPTAEM